MFLCCRNICRVLFTLFLVFLAKLSQSQEPGERVVVGAGGLNFREYNRVPLLCDLTSMADNCLTSANMFYLAFLSLYLFCRQPNPPACPANMKTLKVKVRLRSSQFSHLLS